MGTFGRAPLLFTALALAVVAPYELVVLALTGSAPLGHQRGSVGTWVTLSLIDFALIGPVISALSIHAVVELAQARKPTLVTVVSRGLRVVPVVAAAQIVAGIGIGIGLLAFVVPGVILAIRWAVVAQVAALERTDWMGALRRGAEVTAGNYLHVLGVVFVTAVVAFGFTLAGEAAAGPSADAPQVALGIAIETLTRAFAALTTAMLYFDLVARRMETRPPRPPQRSTLF